MSQASNYAAQYPDAAELMSALDAAQIPATQDWEEETTMWQFGDGSQILVSGDQVEVRTVAERFAAELGDDGSTWETPDGRTFAELADSLGASPEYSRRVYGSDGGIRYDYGFPRDHFAGDPVRYGFGDGSAVVAAGDGWDIEGPEPFSWAGE